MVQRDPSLLKSVKKNTLGTLFVFEVIRFRKKLLNLKEHPIPSLGLSVVLHRESFCFCAEHKNQMLVSVMPKRAWARLSTYAFVRFSILSPYVFVFSNQYCRLKYSHASMVATLGLRICAILAKHFGSDIGLQAILHRSPFRCSSFFNVTSGTVPEAPYNV